MGRKSGRGFSPLRDGLIVFLLTVLSALVIAKLDGLNERRTYGGFVAVDGDTLARDRVRYRLVGIDAPELHQSCGSGQDAWPCGKAARDFLSELLSKNDVECAGHETDRYGRLLVRCLVGDQDLGALLVSAGLAVTTEFFLYAAEERRARTDKIGLWSGHFDHPKNWRREHKAADMETPSAGFAAVLRHILGW